MNKSTKLIFSADYSFFESDPAISKSTIVALIPAAIMSMIFFGHNSLIIILTSVVSCLIINYLAQRLLLKTKRPFWNNNTALTGILLAFCLPPGITFWLVIPGSLVTVAIGTISFGRLSNYRFHPALAGSLFLLLLFPGQMSAWTPTITSADTFTGATPLGLLNMGIHNGQTVAQILSDTRMPGYFDMFWGDVSGSVGEISTMAILVGALYLFMKKIISWQIPLAVLGSMFLLEGILQIASPGRFADPVFHLVTGGAMLGAFFMATYPATLPATSSGKLILGTGIGLITILVRNFGPYPEGIAIAILIMNGLTPLINSVYPSKTS
jgi:Na+-translocating ferredoxin:NAD+ oxidoreductase subunit D